MILYIYLENIYSELNKTWFMMRKFYLWCKLNSLKLNPRKFVFIVLGDKTCCKYILDINSKFVEASDNVIFIDNLCWNA